MATLKKQYRHKVCGTVMTLSDDIAQHHADHPEKIIGALCTHCPPGQRTGQHWPKDQFEWVDGTPFGSAV